MSAIDVYDHKTFGVIECPCTHKLVYNPEIEYTDRTGITIYQLLENIPGDEDCFDGKTGDILVGGGRGEAPALRISNPIAFKFFTLDDVDRSADVEFEQYSEIFKAFWTPRQSFIIGEGFLKVGWTPDRDLDLWLAESVCYLLINEIPEFHRFRTSQIINPGALTLLPYLL